MAEYADTISPERLVDLALSAKERGNIGIAFTYNEPLVGYEFLRDTAKLSKEQGLKNVIVTSGTADLSVWEELKPYIDALNIDLKGFTDRYYDEVLCGNRSQVMEFITETVKTAHVELTTLIVPGENDSIDEMRELSEWVSRIKEPDGEDVPLHITRFFPRFHMIDREPTDPALLHRLADVAGENLKYVYLGNMPVSARQNP